MIHLKNEELKTKTTIKIGGLAENFYIPESEEELIKLISSKELEDELFIGGGSNLLINDEKVFKNVISLKKFNDMMYRLNDGSIYVGASVTLQKFILFVNENECGGIEYLYSVPGLVGGAICMNAGKGKADNKQISDFLISIRVLTEEGKVVEYKKEECNFSYRSSKFKNSNNIILSAIFNFPEQKKEVSEKLRKDRIEMCKKNQDNSYPNFGSVFCEQNKYALRIIRKFRPKNGKACFSSKTNNWILNLGNATFNDVYKLIEKTKKFHKVLGLKCKEEICIWK